MFSLIRFINHLIATPLNAFQSIILLASRLFIAEAFFRSGLAKVNTWENTLGLFEKDYKVEYLSPEVVAYSVTGAELVLPALLVLGLLTRFSAIGLTIINVVAVVSVTDMGLAAMQQHYLWGAVILVVVFWGPGKLSADSLLHSRYTGRRY